MVDVKMNKKDLFKGAKGERPKKANFTFRLNEQLYRDFESRCEKEGVKPTAVLEEFLKFVIAK